MAHHHYNKNQGFTLVELAIVLVIIGLIIGGVLVGQDLIKAASIRRQISQIDRFNAGVNTFRTKYNFLPGDMPVATTYFGTVAVGGITPVDGDGNGYITSTNGTIIGDSTDSSFPKGEVINVFADLSLAGLVSEGTSSNTAGAKPCVINFPRSRLAQAAGIVPYYVNGYNQWVVGYDCLQTAAAATAMTLTQNTFTPSQMQNIDTKMDDGFPATGGVQANSGTTLAGLWTHVAGDTGLASHLACYNAANSAYNVGGIVAGVTVANISTEVPECVGIFRWN